MILIRGVLFEPDGSAVIEFLDPTKDAWRNGVVLNHTLLVPVGDQYDDEIDAVRAAAVHLVQDVHEDLPFLEPVAALTRHHDEDDDDHDEDPERDQ